MSRFRFGLGGLGAPHTERSIYGAVGLDGPERLRRYGERFGCFEANVAVHPSFTADTAAGLLDRLPAHVEILPRLDPDASIQDSLRAIDPWLRTARCGPMYIRWNGSHDEASAERLDEYLSTLWPRIPGKQRLAVEFRDRSWLRGDVMHLLEEHSTGLVWSAACGVTPHRLTSDFIYIRLTGNTRGVPDEVTAWAKRLLKRPQDPRPVYIISARHTEPYGLSAIERCATMLGVPTESTPMMRNQDRAEIPVPMF